jgi:hypothetical protein
LTNDLTVVPVFAGPCVCVTKYAMSNAFTSSLFAVRNGVMEKLLKNVSTSVEVSGAFEGWYTRL